MMKIPHSPHHWIPVALVVAAALFALSEAHGQKQDAGAMYQGRPALAGAQAGQGAMAGPPQGGIGLQGNDDALIALTRRPATVTTPRTDIMGARGDMDVTPKKDNSLGKDQRSVVKKTRKVARRVMERKHGLTPIESRTSG